MSVGLRRGLRRIVDALQLGLFDALEPVAATPPPTSSASPPPSSSPPLIDPTRAEALVDAPWRHREATREALLDGRRVAFRLVRVPRRSIGFVVDADGLTVRAARRVPPCLYVPWLPRGVRVPSGNMITQLPCAM